MLAQIIYIFDAFENKVWSLFTFFGIFNVNQNGLLTQVEIPNFFFFFL